VTETIKESEPSASERGLSTTYDAATSADAAFNARFRHGFATIDGVQMHYVIGGQGPQTMILLHGMAQSWYEWRAIMEDLLPGRTVIAIDLPGLGDSTGEPASYAKTVLATYVHKLLNRLGHHRRIQVVAHDLGVGVAYALAAQYREQVAGLLLMDFPVVGKGVSWETLKNRGSWHMKFFLQEPLAEQLITGRERAFLTYFYSFASPTPDPIPETAIDEYVRTYARPQVLHGGFELYRTWAQDEVDNLRLQETPLTIPVRMLSVSGRVDSFVSAVQAAAPAATGAVLTGAGHWMVEEQPARVLAEIQEFAPAGRSPRPAHR
jgi:pimeloyl-ACP methyl ester carboxylesterase